MEDRRSTEQLYIQKQLRILVATSVHDPFSNPAYISDYLIDISCWSQSTSVLMYSSQRNAFERLAAAHLVIVKGVQTFQNGAVVEYSDLEITQMLGRAVCCYSGCINDIGSCMM